MINHAINPAKIWTNKISIVKFNFGFEAETNVRTGGTISQIVETFIALKLRA